MKLYDHLYNDEILFNELKIHADDSEIERSSRELQEYAFYKLIQNETELNAERLNILLFPHEFLLMVQIAASSTSLLHINLKDNSISCFGSDIVLKLSQSLAQSKSIKIIDFSYNDISEHGPRIVNELCKSNSIQKVNFNCNSLWRYSGLALKTAKAIITMPSLQSFYMEDNNLKKEEITSIEELFIDHNNQVANLNYSLLTWTFGLIEDGYLTKDVAVLIMGHLDHYHVIDFHL